MTAVCGAADALAQTYGDSVRTRPGYRAALIELAVIMNAAVSAATMRRIFLPKLGPHLGVVYGVFNLQTHEVGLPASATEEGVWQAGFCEEAPQAAADFDALGVQMAASRFISQLLS